MLFYSYSLSKVFKVIETAGEIIKTKELAGVKRRGNEHCSHYATLIPTEAISQTVTEQLNGDSL